MLGEGETVKGLEKRDGIERNNGLRTFFPSGG
jgi:hypothetical protein